MPSGEFGNAGRNILRGPGWVTFDLSVQRRINFIESRQRDGSVRTSFNLFNRANFGLPASEHRRDNAGVISALAGDPRVMQFSVRVAF